MLHKLLNLLLCVSFIFLCHSGEVYGQDDAEKLQVEPPQLIKRQGRDVPVNRNELPIEDNKVLKNVGEVIEPNEINLEPQDAAGPQEKGTLSDTSMNDKTLIGQEGEDNNQGLGFVHGFLASISVIIVSEIGDKTFFIAAIMAMQYSRLLVFSGALSALGLMTFLSVCLGYATMIIPRWITFYTCTALLALFGVKMLYEGYKMSPDEGQEEFNEVSEELKKREETLTQSTPQDAEQGLTTVPPLRRRLRLLGPFVSPIYLQAFSLTFLAEWGDRSQITTIILAARENPVGVTVGGTLGHALCTALAVIGGKIVAQRLSVKTVTLIGGVVFLIFALTAFLHDPTAQ